MKWKKWPKKIRQKEWKEIVFETKNIFFFFASEFFSSVMDECCLACVFVCQTNECIFVSLKGIIVSKRVNLRILVLNFQIVLFFFLFHLHSTFKLLLYTVAVVIRLLVLGLILVASKYFLIYGFLCVPLGRLSSWELI